MNNKLYLCTKQRRIYIKCCGSFLTWEEWQQLITSVVEPDYMPVNKVVLLINTTWARKQKLISEISRCCLCLATLGPLRHTAEWSLLNRAEHPACSQSGRSGASTLPPTSLQVPGGYEDRIAHPQLTKGLSSRCFFQQASFHIAHTNALQADRTASGKVGLKTPCKSGPHPAGVTHPGPQSRGQPEKI